jgi:hypothetical protein
MRITKWPKDRSIDYLDTLQSYGASSAKRAYKHAGNNNRIPKVDSGDIYADPSTKANLISFTRWCATMCLQSVNDNTCDTLRFCSFDDLFFVECGENNM